MVFEHLEQRDGALERVVPYRGRIHSHRMLRVFEQRALGVRIEEHVLVWSRALQRARRPPSRFERMALGTGKNWGSAVDRMLFLTF